MARPETPRWVTFIPSTRPTLRPAASASTSLAVKRFVHRNFDAVATTALASLHANAALLFKKPGSEESVSAAGRRRRTSGTPRSAGFCGPAQTFSLFSV